MGGINSISHFNITNIMDKNDELLNILKELIELNYQILEKLKSIDYNTKKARGVYPK